MEAQQTFDMVSYLVTVCPALGILAWVVMYFKGVIKTKDERIDSLTNELIEVSKDQIKVNGEVKNILELYKPK